MFKGTSVLESQLVAAAHDVECEKCANVYQLHIRKTSM